MNPMGMVYLHVHTWPCNNFFLMHVVPGLTGSKMSASEPVRLATILCLLLKFLNDKLFLDE